MTSLVEAPANEYALIRRVKAARLPAPDERRKIRLSAGVSLEELAAELGVTPGAVSRWELGQSEPRTKNALAYRALLDALKKAAA